MALVPFPSTPPAPDDDDPRIELTDSADDLEGGKMSFLEHLDELRTRLIHSVIAIGACCVVSFIFLDRVFDFVTRPMRDMLPAGGNLVQTEPAEFFMLYLKVGVLVGLLIATPFVIWQLRSE